MFAQHAPQSPITTTARARARTTRRMGAVAALAAAVVLTGCQQTVTTTNSPTPTGSPSQPTSGSTPPSTSAPVATSAPAPVTTASTPTPTSPRVRYLRTWQSPSGNIVCQAGGYGPASQVSCQIGSKFYPRPNDAAQCNGAGAGDNAVRLTAGASAEWMCVGDYWGGRNVPTLRYGEIVSVGRLMCESTTGQMTCWEPGSPYGFSLSRNRAELR